MIMYIIPKFEKMRKSELVKNPHFSPKLASINK